MNELAPNEFLPFFCRNAPVVFLDSSSQDKKNTTSFLFYNPVSIVKTHVIDEVQSALKKIDELAKEYWLAGFIAYEAAYGMEQKFRENLNIPRRHRSPLLWFGAFRKPHTYDHALREWNQKISFAHTSKQSRMGSIRKEKSSPVLKATISKGTYARNIKHIKRLIARGHTYQVNYTFDNSFLTQGTPWQVYAAVREQQKTYFGAYIYTGNEYILSFSPELFFRRSGNHIEVKPMKGTAPRGRWSDEDVMYKQTLAVDEKNKSENLMIVDLLRNDLGRVCVHGTVRPTQLFQVETHPTLHQMTSTVTGELESTSRYTDIFNAIFPSGSVTGAPKIHTMEIIHGLERGMRGVYCGAIGYIAPQKKAVFSVPIRTLQKGRNRKTWKYRVGSGIVWDSVSANEWEECKVKCQFLTTTAMCLFDLFETVAWKNGQPLYWHDHIQRLKHSALFFNISFNHKKIRAIQREIKQTISKKEEVCVRIFLKKNGVFRWDSRPMHGKKEKGIHTIFLASKPVDEKNVMVFHKTTYRPWYTDAMRLIQQLHCYDVIFFNKKREITEGARTNIFVERNGVLYTPPLACGLLPGILRQHLLKAHKCYERVLTISDVKKARTIYCGNSVRGLKRVFLR